MAGTIIADTLTHSTAGSVTTDYVVNGSQKFWARWDMSASSLEDSMNASSFTDVSTGVARFDYASSMANAVYGISGIAGEKAGGGNRGLGVNGSGGLQPTTSYIRFYSFNSSWAASDETICSGNISGDLA